MKGCPNRLMAAGSDGRDLPLVDRAIVRAVCRYHSNYYGRDVARFQAEKFAAALEEVRIGNSEWLEDVSRWDAARKATP